MVDRPSESSRAESGSCPAGCAHCSAPARPPADAPHGAELVGWSVAALLGPLVLAAVGAGLCGPAPHGRLIGCGIGLAAGFLLAVGGRRWLNRRARRTCPGPAGQGDRAP